MKAINKIKIAIKNPRTIKLFLDAKSIIKMPDEEYLELLYEAKFGCRPDLKHPKTFNEKINWIKLHYRLPELPGLVDKATAKDNVAKIIGNQYIIPTIGVYDSFDDIDFNKLPNQFVIKCTHDCASVIICRDKKTFDVNAAKTKINKAMKVKYFGREAREWVYSQIRPRIIIEKFMKDDNSNDIIDYKFFCFNGEPKIMYVSTGLENHATASIDFADMNYQPIDIERSDYHSRKTLPPKPKSFSEMKKIAKKLSRNFPFVRVDLYEINGKPFFGELTFYPCRGLTLWKKPEYDERLGKMLVLPKDNTQSS